MCAANNVDLRIFNPYQTAGLKRIGNDHDGGYIIHFPSLDKVDALANYGVGYNIAFEIAFHKLTGKPVYAFDPTMKKLKYFVAGIKRKEYIATFKQVIKLMLWMAKEGSLKKKGICFIEEGLATKNSSDFKTLDYHLSRYNLRDKRILLKIDIEGAEYDVMNEDSFYEGIDNVVQLIVEFHYLKDRINELSNIIKRLERTHSLVHIHGNNYGETFIYNGKHVPEVIEVVLLHNSFMPQKVLTNTSYPIEGLDRPCNWRKRDIPLDFFK